MFSQGYQSLMPTTAVMPAQVLATSSAKKYDLMYYLKGALAGGICCAVTHGALCPVDVVKTKMQLDPVRYNRGLVGTFTQVIAEEGVMGLSTGLGPTVVGYFIQGIIYISLFVLSFSFVFYLAIPFPFWTWSALGWFKFGGVEFFKINFSAALGEQTAWDNRTSIYLLSSACAEFIADIFLCPLEATRIRLVSNPSFANGLIGGAARLASEEGIIKGFYSGFGPILLKQIPYTMAKFAVQGAAAESIAANVVGKDLSTLKGASKLGVALSSGVIAGVAAAIISHPADTLLSKVNKAGAGGDGPIMTRLSKIAGEIGFYKLCTVGLGARCVMIGTLTAGQFLLFDIVMDLTGAEKFHFHNPADKHH